MPGAAFNRERDLCGESWAARRELAGNRPMSRRNYTRQESRKKLDTSSHKQQRKLTRRTSAQEKPPTAKRGRPPLIHDWLLELRRNSLVNSLEFHWGEIAWRLLTARTYAQLARTFAPLVDLRGAPGYPAIESLCRDVTKNVTAEDLRKKREQLCRLDQERAALDSRRSDLHENIRRLRDLCRVTRLELRPRKQEKRKLKQEEHNKIKKVRTHIRDELVQHRRQNKTLRARIEQIEMEARDVKVQLESEEAFFAQTELFKFIKGKRYELTPRNLANAIAGLPLIGCRQSSQRCSIMPYSVSPHANYEAFNLVHRIVSKSPQLSKEKVLIQLRAEIARLLYIEDSEGEYLTNNWYHLKKAVEEACDSSHARLVLPFVIMESFVRNIRQPQPPWERYLAEQAKAEIDEGLDADSR